MVVIRSHNLTGSLCSGKRTGSQEIRFLRQAISLTGANYLISVLYFLQYVGMMFMAGVLQGLINYT